MTHVSIDHSTSPHRADTIEAYETSVVRAIRHMKEHLAEPLDLDELAQIAAISKFHLVRVFDETTGTTPHHFLSCLRVQRAKELLLKSESPITDVCLEVGYNSLGTFSKTFSELVGVVAAGIPRDAQAADGETICHGHLALPRRRAKKFPARPSKAWSKGRAGRKDSPLWARSRSGVPLGVPFSGTVMIGHGKFCIERPAAAGISSAGGIGAALGQAGRNGGEHSHQPTSPACGCKMTRTPRRKSLACACARCVPPIRRL